MAPDVDEFRAEVIRRSGIDPAIVQTQIVGASVGPHLGPGCLGAAVLYRAERRAEASVRRSARGRYE